MLRVLMEKLATCKTRWVMSSDHQRDGNYKKEWKLKVRNKRQGTNFKKKQNTFGILDTDLAHPIKESVNLKIERVETSQTEE